MGAYELITELAGAGICVVVEGDRLVARPASKLTDEMRAALRDAKPELIELVSNGHVMSAPVSQVACQTGREGAAFARYRASASKWRWSDAEVDGLAARLVERDRSGDDRISCVECRHCWPGMCSQYRRAGLAARSIGKDFAMLLQRCPGFAAIS